MAVIAVLEEIIHEFPAEIQTPVRHLMTWTEETLKVPREDFLRLEEAVEKLADAQTRTEQRLEKLTERVDALAAAQTRTEQKLEKLTERIDALAAIQARTEEQVKELAAAQARTEQRVDELAGEIKDLKKSLSDQIAALGSRWGIYNEGTFRATIYGVLGTMEGVTVKEGYYGDRQVDIIIRDGEHILLEITSRMHSRDIDNLYASADDYYKREGVKPKLIVATSYVSPKLMQKIMGLERPIEIFSYEAE